jgi:hypothetical protein
MKRPLRISCDRCNPLMINRVFCHETGCPNFGKVWMADRGDRDGVICGAWVRFRDCFVCGCPVEQGESCDCLLPEDGR